MRNISLEEFKNVERGFKKEFPNDTAQEHMVRLQNYMDFNYTPPTPKKKKIVEIVEPLETVVISEIVESIDAPTVDESNAE